MEKDCDNCYNFKKADEHGMPCIDCAGYKHWTPKETQDNVNSPEEEKDCFTCEHHELSGLGYPCSHCNEEDLKMWKLKENTQASANSLTQIKDYITDICEEIKNLLIEKNESYGNAVPDPIRIFSKADALEQINVRIDDKLSRIMRGKEYGQEDTELDLIGYLILKRAVKRSVIEEL